MFGEPLGHPLLSWFWFVQFMNVIIVAFLIRLLLKHLWRTPAMPVIVMFIVMILIGNVLGRMGFYTFGYLISNLTPVLFISVVLIFHEEIKDLLGTMGRNLRKYFGHRGVMARSEIDSLVEACALLRKLRLGGLFVVEGEESLEHLYGGDPVKLDRLQLNPPLVASILQPPGPLHDGAVIIRNGKIVGARAILPLSKRIFLGRSGDRKPRAELGTRHRAAIGITEVSDAVAVVVSEETGNFSIAHDGILEENLSLEELADRLAELTGREGEDWDAG